MKKLLSIGIFFAVLSAFIFSACSSDLDIPAPTCITGEATNITSTGCTLHGTIDLVKGYNDAPRYGFRIWSTSFSSKMFFAQTSCTVSGTTVTCDIKFNDFLTYAKSGDTFYYQAYVENSIAGTENNQTIKSFEGETKSFIVP